MVMVPAAGLVTGRTLGRDVLIKVETGSARTKTRRLEIVQGAGYFL